MTLRLYDQVLFEHTHWRFLADQHWAVIGGNGAGKTTLMKALCGQVPVLSGHIRYHFADHAARVEIPVRAQEQIAYVSFDGLRTALGSQGSFHQARWNRGVGDGRTLVSAYLSESSVRQINPYQVVDRPPHDAAFAEHRERTIDLLGIENLLRKEVLQLSDGERRKVSLARALMRRPKLLILDNPLTGLDQRFQARLQEIVHGLMQGRLGDGMRVIVVTPREDEIPPGVTHVLLVDQCRVIAQGPRKGVSESALMKSAPAPPIRMTNSPPDREPRPQILVDMRRVNVSYGTTPILQEIDWTVRRGEHWALLGPNGAGKTTLLSLILGDHPQVYANEVRLFGRRRGSGESIWEIKRRIGWVAPELHLYYPADRNLGDITGLQVVGSGFYDSIGLYRTCSPEQRERAKQWMEQLGVGDRAHVPFARLSEGEQRLVLLARALVKHPMLLILDEPCQGLDARMTERVRQVVEAVGSHMDTSVIYVTHHANELPRIINRVLRLDRGQADRNPNVHGYPLSGDANRRRTRGGA